MPFEPDDILYFHGLESSPQGHKATWLRTHHGARTPAFDNQAAIAAWRDRSSPRHSSVLHGPLATARQALEAPPRVLIGSSFGGMLAGVMIREGLWDGPTILLAPAYRKVVGDAPLPASVPLLVVHGRHDTVVPVQDGRWLATTAGGTFWELDDDHALRSILRDGTLELALRWAASRT